MYLWFLNGFRCMKSWRQSQDLRILFTIVSIYKKENPLISKRVKIVGKERIWTFEDPKASWITHQPRLTTSVFSQNERTYSDPFVYLSDQFIGTTVFSHPATNQLPTDQMLQVHVGTNSLSENAMGSVNFWIVAVGRIELPTSRLCNPGELPLLYAAKKWLCYQDLTYFQGVGCL